MIEDDLCFLYRSELYSVGVKRHGFCYVTLIPHRQAIRTFFLHSALLIICEYLNSIVMKDFMNEPPRIFIVKEHGLSSQETNFKDKDPKSTLIVANRSERSYTVQSCPKCGSDKLKGVDIYDEPRALCTECDWCGLWSCVEEDDNFSYSPKCDKCHTEATRYYPNGHLTSYSDNHVDPENQHGPRRYFTRFHNYFKCPSCGFIWDYYYDMYC